MLLELSSDPSKLWRGMAAHMVTTLHKEGAKVAAHKPCPSSHQDAVPFNARLGLHWCGRVCAHLHGCLPCLQSIRSGSWAQDR